MEDLLEKISDLKRIGKSAALLIVTKTQGSVPRRAGVKMIVLKDRTTIGTMGGGDLEKKAIEEALEAIRNGESRIAFLRWILKKGNWI